MIQLWAEVYDPTYTTQIADSDLRLVRANVERNLDGPGRVDIETSVLHVDFTLRALSVLTPKRVVEVWYQESEDTTARVVSSFVIESIEYKEEPGGMSFSVRGADTMSLLMNTTTSLNLQYDNELVSDVVDDLMDLAGWGQSFDNTGTTKVTTRFDGTSILKAVQAIAEETGFHFRLGSTFKTIVFGELGDDSGLTVTPYQGDKPWADRADGVIPLETIDITTDASGIVNKIIPLSAGDGDSRGTIEKSTGSYTYSRQSETGPDSRTIYYLSDSTSVTAYGTIEKVLNFKKIAPIGTSSTSRQRTADYLHQAANEWLARHKDPLTEVQARCTQQRTNFDVGDKVRLEYVRQLNVGGTPVTVQSINGLYWVMSARETYGDGGEGANLLLTNIDRESRQNGDEVVEVVDGVEVFETGYKATYNIWSMGPYSDYVSTSQGATFELVIPDDCLQVENVTVILSTYSDRQSYVPSVPLYVTLSSFDEPGSPIYPYSMTIKVNGSTVASGVAASSAVQISGNEYDVTDEVLGAGDDGRGSHTILVTGSTGGLVTLQFLIRGLIVPGKV